MIPRGVSVFLMVIFLKEGRDTFRDQGVFNRPVGIIPHVTPQGQVGLHQNPVKIRRVEEFQLGFSPAQPAENPRETAENSGETAENSGETAKNSGETQRTPMRRHSR